MIRTLAGSWFALVLLIFFPLSTWAGSAEKSADWPQWRGSERDGHAPGFEAPADWPAKMERLWSTEVGAGYSSPVARENRICTHTRQGDDEIATCLSIATGEVLWRQSYAAPFAKNSYALQHGEGPNATPTLQQDQLLTLGMSGILSSFDSSSGELLWRAHPEPRLSTGKLFCGTAASPLVVGETVIVHIGDDVNGGALVAYDLANGEVRWSREDAGPGYASPVFVELDGKRQIVGLTLGSVFGVAADSGDRLWQIDFEDEWNENIVTPVFSGDTLLVAGVRRGTLAFRIAGQGGTWSVAERWDRADLPQYMSTPVLDSNVLYGFSSRQKGQLFALDVERGMTHWTSSGRMGRNAALIAAGADHLAVLTTEGELLFVSRGTQSFQVAARYRVAEQGTWSYPVLIDSRIAVKDASSLSLWSLE